MGSGKTEAALYAAYRIIEEKEATGIYFALPTQLTSNKVYERMNEFVGKIITPSAGIEKTHLVHSTAWLHDVTLGEDGDSGGSWFDGTKRGILAPFAVGTVDQALMAVMNVRHGFVRTFGLAGKVVILDEVHSYDTYTGTIIDALISLLRQLHCTVIILSATLTESQKRSLLHIDESIEHEYPLVSGYPSTKTISKSFFQKPAGYNEQLEVTISLDRETDTTAFSQAVQRASNRQQVLWIENTVDEAQETFRILSASLQGLGIECGLLHSRFILKDRTTLEEHWISLLGKEGRDKRTQCGRILVGTQVLEQSLDIDADFLITRICPTDMLLQRIGRLWRHRENDTLRPTGSCCEVEIISPSYDAVVQGGDDFGKTGKVYSPYVLLRTLEAWNGRTAIQVPRNIRLLLEATYSEREETGIARQYKEELRTEKEKLQQMAAIGLSHAIQTLPESKAHTRYSEIDSINVLLLSDISGVDGGQKVRFLDGSECYIPAFSKDPKQKRIIAATLLQQCVRVSDYIAPLPIQNLSWLKPYVYVGSRDDDETPFRLAIVQKDEALRGFFEEEINERYSLHYNSILGYQSHKR